MKDKLVASPYSTPYLTAPAGCTFVSTQSRSELGQIAQWHVGDTFGNAMETWQKFMLTCELCTWLILLNSPLYEQWPMIKKIRHIRVNCEFHFLRYLMAIYLCFQRNLKMSSKQFSLPNVWYNVAVFSLTQLPLWSSYVSILQKLPLNFHQNTSKLDQKL